MAGSGTASPLVAGVALLERAIGFTLGSLVLVGPEDLARRTPCDRWDLHTLLDHMNDSLLALEVAVHGWDVGRACGRPRTVPAPLATELLDLAPLLVRPADRRCRFAMPVETASSADPGDRLVAFLGRDPGWA